MQDLKIRKHAFGPNDIEVSGALNRMSKIYLKQKRHEEALVVLEEARVIRLNVLTKQHPDYARVLYNMALHHIELGRHEKALEYLLEALDIRKLKLAKDNSETIATFQKIVSIYSILGNSANVIRYCEEAIECDPNQTRDLKSILEAEKQKKLN